jgi:hypothetical protein
MGITDPQFLYMVLILPCLFGLTLIGEGITKLFRAQWSGLVSVVAGSGFIGVIVLAYFILNDML